MKTRPARPNGRGFLAVQVVHLDGTGIGGIARDEPGHRVGTGQGPLAVGKGRCAATEILVGTDAVANLIREGKCYQIPSILQSGAALGMHSLNADLARLVSTGRITREAAERCATNKSDLKNYL